MTERIPFVALDRQHAGLATELAAAFERVVDTSAFILGEEVERFEAEFARYCGVQHCIGVASGTAALTLSLIAAGIGPGDRVVVPAHTFIASVLGILHTGATPVLCDVDPHTGLIDVKSAAAAVDARTTAILAVHLYGQVCDIEALQALAERCGVALLEDAAQAHGATYRGARAGSFGRASAFSFYPSKNLGALGDGGAICTDDPEVARRSRLLRNLGQQQKGVHSEPGFNERLDGLQAAFLRVKLPSLERWNQARRRNAAVYRGTLPSTLGVLPEQQERECVYHLFPVRLRERDALAEQLGESGVQTGTHYTPPLHRQPALEGRIEAPQDYPHAAAWAREELSLPMSESLSEGEVARVAEIVCDCLAANAE